jgi:hypothetical protein
MEVDFAFWFRRDRFFDESDEPVLALGEAKSFAKDAFGPEDVRKLDALSAQFPGAFLVVSKLGTSFSHKEKRRLQQLALRGRIPLDSGLPRGPVIVLTGVELFADWSIEREWKKRGGAHADLVKPAWRRLDNLWTLADVTQQLYLDLPSYGEWLEDRTKQRQRGSR